MRTITAQDILDVADEKASVRINGNLPSICRPTDPFGHSGKIAAIRLLRDLGKLPLKESKDLVDDVLAHGDLGPIARAISGDKEIVSQTITRLTSKFITVEVLHVEKGFVIRSGGVTLSLPAEFGPALATAICDMRARA